MAHGAERARRSAGMNAIQALVQDAAAAGRKLRISAAGTWLDAGHPITCDDTISLTNDRGIVQYEPGDLTMTARAGTTIGELTEAAGRNEQWVPLDPWGGDSGTLGATLSTATAGPHSISMGLPRDVVLGMEFVTGAGDVIRSGGRVVKNVAGFDLTRLVVGSWGTLGVITEATIRLRARPAETRTLAVELTDSAQMLNELAVKLRSLPFTPLAAEVVNGALAFALGVGDRSALLIRVGGNARALLRQVDEVRKLGESRDFEERVWPALREAEPKASAAWRWSRLSSEFGNCWIAAQDATRDVEGALIHGSPLRGMVRVIVPAQRGDARLGQRASRFEGSIAIERLAAAEWRGIKPRTDGNEALRQSVRAKFDPKRILNAGILGETS
jgi:glycolate oxidase FAD binding subunit